MFRTRQRFTGLSTLFGIGALSLNGLAQESVSIGASTSDGIQAQASGSELKEDFSQAPIEFGIFAGAFFPSSSHNWFNGPATGHEAFAPVNLEVGGRAAGFPLPYLGIEAEAAGVKTKGDVSDVTAAFFLGRGHLIGQLPLDRLSLFALLGGGAITVASNQSGSDTDPTMHFGIGAKYALSELIGLRLDVRDTLSQKHLEPQDTLTHSPEVLLGLSFGVKKIVRSTAAAPTDSDGDGVNDDRDACADVAGPAPAGCPDTDADGIFDDKDACPKEAGPSSGCGCPLKDRDNDRFIDELDKCPDQPGPIDGCVDEDPDRDGVTGAADKCPNKAETMNGFEDADGCPDVMPDKVKSFTGIIQGIQFDKGTEKVRPATAGTLDNAVLILNEYPSLRILITGHTDTDGTRELNLELSQRRADAVKTYLVDKGVAADRIETRGAAFDEPIADNKTNAGKQKNRRIEIKVIGGVEAAPPAAPAAPSAPAPAAKPKGAAPAPTTPY